MAMVSTLKDALDRASTLSQFEMEAESLVSGIVYKIKSRTRQYKSVEVVYRTDRGDLMLSRVRYTIFRIVNPRLMNSEVLLSFNGVITGLVNMPTDGWVNIG